MTSRGQPQTCSILGCSAPVAARGWCACHYQRWRRHGDPNKGGSLNEPARSGGEGLNRRSPTSPVCSIEGCGARVAAFGYCYLHYHRLRRHEDALAGGKRRRTSKTEIVKWKTAMNSWHVAGYVTHTITAGRPMEIHWQADRRERRMALAILTRMDIVYAE